MTAEDYESKVTMMGNDNGTLRPVKVDPDGAIVLAGLDAVEITADMAEVQTWDSPLVSIISNLNRIRYAIIHLSGEAWGTFSHSIAAIWAKFDTTTGHAHSGSADDGQPVDHGTTTGKGDDDHTQYLNETRHDTTTRHSLGTVVPHDAASGITPDTSEAVTWDATLTTLVNNLNRIRNQIIALSGEAWGTVTTSTKALHDAGFLTVLLHDTTTRHSLGTVVPHDSAGGVTADSSEATTWDATLTTLTNNLNRIRNQVLALSGEAWGTVTTSTAALFAKFHATTGHKHTATTGDAPQLDHGQLGGLGDVADHPSYFLLDGTRKLTGTGFWRGVTNDLLVFYGSSDNIGGVFEVFGKDFADATYAGGFNLYVSNAAKTGLIEVLRIKGDTNVPVLQIIGMPVYANNAAAVAGGLIAGCLYRNNADPDHVLIVH